MQNTPQTPGQELKLVSTPMATPSSSAARGYNERWFDFYEGVSFGPRHIVLSISKKLCPRSEPRADYWEDALRFLNDTLNTLRKKRYIAMHLYNCGLMIRQWISECEKQSMPISDFQDAVTKQVVEWKTHLSDQEEIREEVGTLSSLGKRHFVKFIANHLIEKYAPTQVEESNPEHMVPTRGISERYSHMVQEGLLDVIEKLADDNIGASNVVEQLKGHRIKDPAIAAGVTDLCDHIESGNVTESYLSSICHDLEKACTAFFDQQVHLLEQKWGTNVVLEVLEELFPPLLDSFSRIPSTNWKKLSRKPVAWAGRLNEFVHGVPTPVSVKGERLRRFGIRGSGKGTSGVSRRLFDSPAAETQTCIAAVRSYIAGFQAGKAPDKPAMCLHVLEFVKLMKERLKEDITKDGLFRRVNGPTYVFGDIHGMYRDVAFFEKNFVPLGAATAPGNYVFIGDYVDRGTAGVEVVLDLLLKYYDAPEKFILLRGNHETKFEDLGKPPQFIEDCNAFGSGVKEAFYSLFGFLPLGALVNNNLLCLHAGVPRCSYRSFLQRIKTAEQSALSCSDGFVLNAGDRSLGHMYYDDDIMPDAAAEYSVHACVEDIIWSDPAIGIEDTRIAPYGFSKNQIHAAFAHGYSKDAVERFLEQVGRTEADDHEAVQYLIRGHQSQLSQPQISALKEAGMNLPNDEYFVQGIYIEHDCVITVHGSSATEYMGWVLSTPGSPPDLRMFAFSHRNAHSTPVEISAASTSGLSVEHETHRTSSTPVASSQRQESTGIDDLLVGSLKNLRL